MTDEREIIIQQQRAELDSLRRLVVELERQVAQAQAHNAEAWDELQRVQRQRHEAVMVLLRI